MTQKQKQVLLVEDDLDVAEVVMEILISLGYKVEWQPTAEAGYRRLMEAPEYFDAILSDNDTGGRITGLQFLQLTRQDQKTRYKWFILASGNSHYDGRYLGEYVSGEGSIFLQKPISIVDLRRAGF